jgi:hypothetical protein
MFVVLQGYDVPLPGISLEMCTDESVCLFSWRYNPSWLYFPQPGSGLWPPRFRGFLITHKDAPQSVGLLWTSDQSVAETST